MSKFIKTITEEESKFLNKTTVKKVIKSKEIISLEKAVREIDEKADKLNDDKFEKALEQGRECLDVNQWWSSDERKELLKENGIQWGKEEFTEKAYGISKSWWSRLVKSAQWTDEQVAEFIALCESSKDEEKRIHKTIDNLNAFGKGTLKTEETEGEGEGEGEEAEEEPQSDTIFTLSYKGEGVNMALRMTADNVIHTKNTKEEIQALLNDILSKM
tara:strand:- start:1261 stop:1908 length:648 start_codon:yes stop_codon:yes gene_type:complete